MIETLRPSTIDKPIQGGARKIHTQGDPWPTMDYAGARMDEIFLV